MKKVELKPAVAFITIWSVLIGAYVLANKHYAMEDKKDVYQALRDQIKQKAVNKGCTDVKDNPGVYVCNEDSEVCFYSIDLPNGYFCYGIEDLKMRLNEKK